MNRGQGMGGREEKRNCPNTCFLLLARSSGDQSPRLIKGRFSLEGRMSSPRRHPKGFICCPKLPRDAGYNSNSITILLGLNNIPRLTEWELSLSPREHQDLKGCVIAGVWDTHEEEME